MITISQIANGATYLGKHLSANDYYSEGEKVAGQWWGQGAERLQLAGRVGEREFEALRTNRHPLTGGKLTARDGKKNAFHDITISAPKSVSILAVVGEDERVREAFKGAVESALEELERQAAVRERVGKNAVSEKMRPTGNVIAAVFYHDTSRLLDPQLHAHAVLANATFDPQRGRWYALQPKAMMEASPDLTRRFRHDLARRLEGLGYAVEWTSDNFRVRGISPEMEDRFSQRTLQRRAFEERYRQVFGGDPSKKRVESFIKEGKTAAANRFREEYREAFGSLPRREEVEAFVRDWRDPKLKTISTRDVRSLQKSRLPADRFVELRQVVNHARHAVSLSQNSASPRVGEAREKPSWRRSSPRKVFDPGMAGSGRDPVHKTDRGRRVLVAQARGEGIRRLRRGLAVQAAFRGFPQALIASSVRRAISNPQRRLRPSCP